MTEKTQTPPADGPAPGGRPAGPPQSGPARWMAGPSLEKASNFKSTARRLLRNLRPERGLIVTGMVLTAASVGLMVTGPKILGTATDLIFEGAVSARLPAGLTKTEAVERIRASGDSTFADMVASMDVTPGHGIDFTAVGWVLMGALAVYVGAMILGVIQARITATVVQRSMYRLREQAQAKLSRLPLSYFDRHQRGEVLSRVTNDIDNLSQSMQQTLSMALNSLLTIVGVLIMMLWISPLLALVAVITVPLSMLVATRIGRRSKPEFIQQWASTGKLNAHIEEMYTGHTLVSVFGRKDEAAETFTEHNDKLFKASFKAQFISGLIQPALMFIGNMNYVLVAVIGGLRVASGDLSLGSVQAFVQYSRQFTQPLNQVASMANLLQSGIASAERVFELLDADEQQADTAKVKLGRVQGQVAFEHVSFAYAPDKPLIEDLSLTVEPGQTVAIVGPTGAGKTTLVNLLMRFYEVTGGRITLDGVDIAALRREDLRARTGMVLQDAWLFGGTIADNIAYGNGQATREQIVAAAKATQVDHFVRTLPDGYDTVLDDEGDSVSAGEKQLITIARAFLAEPAILILDEATSSVDTRTEVLIQRAMSSLRQGRTSFVIAHRLSTIRDADLILVMESGSIVEQGTHADLLQADGAYRRLYAAQFAQALTGAA